MTAGLAVVQAQETIANEAPVMALFPQFGAEQMLNITPFAYPASVGGKIGMGFLNIFFGLGSWIAGDWQNGLYLTLMQGGGIALTILGSEWFNYMGPEKYIILGIFPVLTSITGVCLWAWGVVDGFIVPFKKPKTAQLNDPRNWTAAIFPTPNGSVAGALAFTAHF